MAKHQSVTDNMKISSNGPVRNSQTQRIDLTEGSNIEAVVDLERVDPRPQRRGSQKKKEPVAYLVIGFDTEYQSIDAVSKEEIKGGEAHYEVLSYQFWVRLVCKDNAAGPPVESSGIVIPPENERIGMNDYLVFAIGAFMKEHPTVRVPAEVYLVGHFTRADLPAFSDFKRVAKQGLSNVRNTFVSVDKEHKLDLFDDEGNKAMFFVKLRDTIILAPAGEKKLSAIGQIVDVDKIVLADTPEAEQKIKENMKAFRTSNWAEFRAYAIRDAEICVRYSERIIRQCQDVLGEFRMPLSLTEFGPHLLIDSWQKNNLNPTKLLGRETSNEKKYNKKLGHLINRKTEVYIDTVYFDITFVTETYHGGRNEQFVFGICDEGAWRDHDLSSAYPTAMSMIGAPDWSTTRPLKSLMDIKVTDLAFASVDFEFPESVRFPTLPVRSANGIIFPRKGRSYCAAPEILLAKNLGANLTLHRGVIVDTDAEKPIYKDFITDCIRRRKEHPKNTFGNLFWKEVGNSTYGKTAQGLREKRVFDLREDEMVAIPESKITQPFFASFTTSLVRAVLGEMLNRFNETVQVFSVTTDGFLSDATDSDIADATEGPIYDAFAKARRDLGGEPLEIKHEIKQPIGWRTRGSATLKPGYGQDGIVLQKGGIKLNAYYELPEENDVMISLFLNRTPDQKLEYSIGMGLKMLMHEEVDFVYRALSKRLSMEFDWKRMPVRAQERTVIHKGQNYTQVSFETVPLENHEEFIAIRDAWEKFDINPRRVLKTKSDFDEFWEFLQNGRLTNNSVSRYLHKKGGAIKPLRQQLATAFKSLQAGFDLVVTRNGKISHQSFCDALNASGIPCKITDIENAKRKKFEPYQTPATDDVLNALKMIKNIYPDIDDQMFIADANAP